jgi:hypothetical protein
MVKCELKYINIFIFGDSHIFWNTQKRKHATHFGAAVTMGQLNTPNYIGQEDLICFKMI